MNLSKRIEKLEENSTPGEQIRIERVIIDNEEQIQHRDKFRKVLVREDETRKIFELKQ